MKDNGLKGLRSELQTHEERIKVDEDISKKEIIEFIESEDEVLSIRRFNKRNKDLVTQDTVIPNGFLADQW